MKYRDKLINLCITELQNRDNDDKTEDKILTLYSNDSRRKEGRFAILEESMENIKTKLKEN